jgi:hypothetical protein
LIATLASLCGLAACGGGDEASWQLVTENEPASLLSVWGTDVDDVWTVGGRAGSGNGPLVYHYDGTAWETIDTGEVDLDLWIVFGFDGGPVFFGGSAGTILRYEGGTFERLTTPGTAKVFGMWGPAPDDVWAVGGNGAGGGFVWHFDGEAWSEVAGVPDDLVSEGTVFKVTGTAADDLYMPCSEGSILHTTGAGEAFDRDTIDADVLFSIAVGDAGYVAAGEVSSEGLIVENDGSGWVTSEGIPGAPAWRGAAASGELAYVVGEFGSVGRREGTTWEADAQDLTQEDFHAVWIDPAGGVWAVGGQFDQPVTKAGMLLHKGDEVAPLP